MDLERALQSPEMAEPLGRAHCCWLLLCAEFGGKKKKKKKKWRKSFEHFLMGEVGDARVGLGPELGLGFGERESVVLLCVGLCKGSQREFRSTQRLLC